MTGSEMYAALEIGKIFPDMPEAEAMTMAARIQEICRYTQVDVLEATRDVCQWMKDNGMSWQEFPGLGKTL